MEMGRWRGAKVGVGTKGRGLKRLVIWTVELTDWTIPEVFSRRGRVPAHTHVV